MADEIVKLRPPPRVQSGILESGEIQTNYVHQEGWQISVTARVGDGEEVTKDGLPDAVDANEAEPDADGWQKVPMNLAFSVRISPEALSGKSEDESK